MIYIALGVCFLMAWHNQVRREQRARRRMQRDVPNMACEREDIDPALGSIWIHHPSELEPIRAKRTRWITDGSGTRPEVYDE